MCHVKFHTCQYCRNQYPCAKKDWACPTLNGDTDRNLCLDCANKLEAKLDSLDRDVSAGDVDIRELLMNGDE